MKEFKYDIKKQIVNLKVKSKNICSFSYVSENINTTYISHIADYCHPGSRSYRGSTGSIVGNNIFIDKLFKTNENKTEIGFNKRHSIYDPFERCIKFPLYMAALDCFNDIVELKNQILSFKTCIILKLNTLIFFKTSHVLYYMEKLERLKSFKTFPFISCNLFILLNKIFLLYV